MAEAALLVLHICMYVYLYEPFVAFLFVFMVYSVEILSFLSRGGGVPPASTCHHQNKV